ncbi:wax ester/triacylglycerol synthase family O-acyltransferase [Streptomyces microflavus]|uniref:wax ester/triacylglycerol synthase family O-acyltransferase n=1 Tax=Streptomyces microflavus TaxID=1919 RepID=UPI002250381F|nr:wax ester/triacylglycerol synthase family O-acyltransferase [Streptomyces microflavus]MCX4656648.1 wax ester/triacylglycerol synthase family O-acyltransferase [Streptomyces microflavus]WSS32648.1 wax ester/triacylglycerol synthase family O-acyltransferase [Streptomyces microflavus]WST18819.1 wax ester/triacylglycerol synthase family O-acyltransferase [Streptomyces microflavus]
MGTELLAPLDLAFWHLESDAHPMHLGALAVFAPASGVTRLHVLELLRTRAAAIPRLRMCVRDVLLPVGGAAWTVDKDFDVHRHVHRVAVAHGDFMAGATRLAGELMEQPLGRGLPPWQMYLIGGADDGPFAVLVKLHHALADGMRAVAIGAGIFDEIAATAARPGARGRPAVPPRSWLPDPREVAGMALGRIGEVGRALGVGASVVRAGRLDLRGDTAFTAPSSGTRRLATADLDATALQRIRRAEGGTANDILLAVVAGALRRWMEERGEALTGTDPRALVPVSRRRPGGAVTGNRLSAYLLDLPVGTADPRERLRTVRGAMDRNKAAGPLKGAGAVAVLADQLHPLAHRFGAPLAANAARMLFDLLVTSVPLPRSALSLGGCPLSALYPMAPLARGQSLAVALSTYGGRVHVGLVADGKALPDLDRLAEAVQAEFDAIGALFTAGRVAAPVS